MKLAGVKIAIAAGGTGGHMVPADVIAKNLIELGAQVILLSDERGMRFPGLFTGIPKHVTLSAASSGGSAFARLQALLRVIKGTIQARRILQDFAPDLVIGFGGYPSFPACLASLFVTTKTLLCEQNAVLGRANRWLLPWVDALALSYPQTKKVKPGFAFKTVVTGNPVRDELFKLARYRAPLVEEEFRLLVVGGSQGASFFSQLIPAVMELLPLSLRGRISLVQQAPAKDQEALYKSYRRLDIKAEIESYFVDIPQRLEQAHLVISRAGASSVAELLSCGRPAIYIPLPSAMDNHQYYNARALVEQGIAFLSPQLMPSSKQNPKEHILEQAHALQQLLSELMLHPQALQECSKRALDFTHIQTDIKNASTKQAPYEQIGQNAKEALVCLIQRMLQA